MQGGYVALQGAVALDGDEAPLGAQTLALGIDDGDVLGVDLRHHHGHIICPAVGGVVGDDGALQLGVLFLQCPDLLFFHIHCTKAEIHHTCQLFRISLRVQHHQGLCLLGHGHIQGPAAFHGLGVGLSGAAGTGCQRSEAEPGVMFHQCNKPLSHHAGTADYAHFILFHSAFLLPGARGGGPVDFWLNVPRNCTIMFHIGN